MTTTTQRLMQAPSSETVIETEGLSIAFGDFYAVKDVDFKMNRNEAVGVIGPNGAGKTTFVSLLSGQFPPTSGTIRLFGKDAAHVSTQSRVDEGILRSFQLVQVFDNLTVQENIALAYYKKALQVRALLKDEYDKLFKRFHMILSPVAPTTAYRLGENVADPIKMYMGDIYTVSVNLAGLPAAALPCGFDNTGLPIGFQLIGGAFGENKLVEAARVYQRRTDFHRTKPGGVAECSGKLL